MSISTVPEREEVPRQPLKVECDKCHKQVDFTFPLYSPRDFTRKNHAYITSTKWCNHCEAILVVRAYYELDQEKRPTVARTELLDPETQRLPKEAPRGLTVKPRSKRPVRVSED